jgi:hypothetical protein
MSTNKHVVPGFIELFSEGFGTDEPEPTMQGIPVYGSEQSARQGVPMYGSEQSARQGVPVYGSEQSARQGVPVYGSEQSARRSVLLSSPTLICDTSEVLLPDLATLICDTSEVLLPDSHRVAPRRM